jgi:beta-aspartyl-peptidase (threonine type)
LGELGPEFSEDIEYYLDDKKNYDMFEVYRNYKDHMWGTVNVMAIDMNGDIATGVTTSGTYLKLPGRVGDSPLIGAGNYCDNRYGAAACTGIGELAIRHGTARTVVTYMKMGMTPEKACMEVIREINEMNEHPVMDVLAFTPDGEVVAASTDDNAKYYYMSEDMVEVEKTRIWIK